LQEFGLGPWNLHYPAGAVVKETVVHAAQLLSFATTHGKRGESMNAAILECNDST